MSQNAAHLYPLMEHAPDLLRAVSGRSVADIDPEAAAAGDLQDADLQIAADTLHAQADIAHAAGFIQVAENLKRAAELTAVPNQDLLDMYEMLRPNRSTYQELLDLADELATQFGAVETARFVRQAAHAYETRGLVRLP